MKLGISLVSRLTLVISTRLASEYLSIYLNRGEINRRIKQNNDRLDIYACLRGCLSFSTIFMQFNHFLNCLW